MARIRTIKPAFFSSLSNAELPKPTRLTWIGLWTYVDDKGRGVDDARLVKAAIWPLDDDYTTKKVELDLKLLDKVGKIGRYEVEGKRYFAIRKWEHQRINKPQPSVLPAAPWEERSGNVPGTGTEQEGNDPGTTPSKGGGEVEGKGMEGKGDGIGREGKVNSSSSNHQSVGRRAADDDEGSPTQRTLAIIADRRIAAAEAAGAVIQNPGGYRRKVLQGVNGEFGDQAEKLLMEGMDPESVADELVPASSAAAKRYPAFDANSGPRWDVDENGFAIARTNA